MLEITVTLSESWDEKNQEFVYEEVKLELEHSLVAMSKWESIHEKFFLGVGEKTQDEIMSYIECMIYTPGFPPDIVSKFTDEDFVRINKYIDAKMTATTFTEPKNVLPPREKISNELVYYWIVSYDIPWEVQHWHLNRLFTLIKVFNAKNTKEKPKSKSEMLAERRALNEQRLRENNTRG